MTVDDDPYDIRPYFMEHALAEERSNRVTRAWAVLFLVLAGGYFFGLSISLVLFSKMVYPLLLVGSSWFDWVVTLPTSILLVLSGMAWVVSSHNSVMELHPHEREQIKGSPDVWSNLPGFGRVLYVVFGSALVLGVITLVLRIGYKLIF